MHNRAPHRLVYSKVYVDMENLFFILVLSLRSVRQNEDAPCFARPIHGEGALALEQFSTRAILSHTMTRNGQKVVQCV